MRPLVGVRYFHGLRADRTPNIFSTTRDRLYFGDQHLYLADSYLAAARAVAASGCQNVGLDAFLLHYDYPMLALLRAGMGGPAVHYVGVQNRSAVYDRIPAPTPCAVVCLGCARVHQKWREHTGSGILALQFDRTVVFLRESLDDSSKATGTLEAVPRKPAKAISSVSKNPNSDLSVVDGDICNTLPDGLVQNLIGGPVSRNPEGSGCQYESAAGQIQIATFPPNSYYSQEYETLAAEGMGSLQVREQDHSLTIVLDRDNPVLAYLHKGNATYSLNIDRNNPRPAPEDYVRLAELVSRRVLSSRSTPAN
jgi:hypothetical protein